MIIVNGQEVTSFAITTDGNTGGNVGGNVGGKGGLSIYAAYIKQGATGITYNDILIPNDRELQVGDLLIDTNTAYLYRVVSCIPASQSSTPVIVECIGTLLQGSGNGGVFYIRTSGNDGVDLTVNKTVHEIITAFEHGLIPIIRHTRANGSDQFFSLMFISDDKTSVAFNTFENGTEYQILVESNDVETWVYGDCIIQKEYALKSDLPQHDNVLYVEVYDIGGSYIVGRDHLEVEEAYNSGRSVTVIYKDLINSSTFYLPLGSRQMISDTACVYVFSQVINGTTYVAVLTADTNSVDYPKMVAQEVKEVISQIDNEKVVQDVLNALPTWEGGNY